MRGIILIILYILSVTLLSCESGKSSLKDDLNNGLDALSDIDEDLLKFRVVKYNDVTDNAELEIACNFEKIDSAIYLDELSKAEKFLLHEGIKGISYRIINKSPNAQDALLAEDLHIQEDTYSSYDTTEDNITDDSALYSRKDLKKNGYRKLKTKHSRNKRSVSKLVLNKNMIVNANFVKLRKEGLVTSSVLTYLFKGVVVSVHDRSKNKFSMPVSLSSSNNSYYWYKVSTRYKRLGWVFGKYLDPTSIKSVSSYLKNNIIYRDFINKRSLLLKKSVIDSMKRSKYSIDILFNVFALYISSEMKIYLPFRVANNTVHWKLNEIHFASTREKEGTASSLASEIPPYGNNSSVIDLGVGGARYGTKLGYRELNKAAASSSKKDKKMRQKLSLKDYEDFLSTYDAGERASKLQILDSLLGGVRRKTLPDRAKLSLRVSDYLKATSMDAAAYRTDKLNEANKKVDNSKLPKASTGVLRSKAVADKYNLEYLEDLIKEYKDFIERGDSFDSSSRTLSSMDEAKSGDIEREKELKLKALDDLLKEYKKFIRKSKSF